MKEDTLYRNILRDSWRLTWKHKGLWVLGILAIFWGDLGAYQSLNAALGDVHPRMLSSLPNVLSIIPAKLPSFSTGGMIAGILITVLVSVILIALLVLVISARGGLLFAILQRSKKRSVSAKEGLRRGLRAFWPLLGVGIITKLDLILAFFVLNPLMNLEEFPLALPLFMSSFVITTLVSLVLAFLGIYASALIILEGHSFKNAIVESFAIFSRHWLVSIELALILYGLGFLVGIALLIGLFVLSVPFILVGSIITLMHIPWALWLVIIPAIIAYIAILVLVGAAFVTFQYACWTLLFLRIREHGAVAKIVRVTSRFGHILHRHVI